LQGALQHALAHDTPSDSSLMAHYPDAMQCGAILNGVLLLACAYGIYRRFLFAWWAGFVVLLLGQTFSAINLLSRDDLGAVTARTIRFCTILHTSGPTESDCRRRAFSLRTSSNLRSEFFNTIGRKRTLFAG